VLCAISCARPFGLQTLARDDDYFALRFALTVPTRSNFRSFAPMKEGMVAPQRLGGNSAT